jgi:peptidoglycan hydrolase CwlO-like protein
MLIEKNAQQKLDSIKEEFKTLTSKPNKTPADKEKLKQLEARMKHEQGRIKRSENHSMKPKK